MRVMGIRHMIMHMPQRLMVMAMAVFARGHRVVAVCVVAIVVPVRVLMLQRFVGVFVAMGFSQVQHHAGQHQRAAQCQHCTG